MNIASIIILLIIAACVWYSIRTLRRGGGDSCHSGGCGNCSASCNLRSHVAHSGRLAHHHGKRA